MDGVTICKFFPSVIVILPAKCGEKMQIKCTIGKVGIKKDWTGLLALLLQYNLFYGAGKLGGRFAPGCIYAKRFRPAHIFDDGGREAP